MNIDVFKFGGSSVRDASSIKNVADIIKRHSSSSLVVVISAMGKTTNNLEDVYRIWKESPAEGKSQLDIIINGHLKVCNELGLDINSIEAKLIQLANNNIDLLARCNKSSAKYDQIISLGELFSTTIIEAYLRSIDVTSQWLDIREIMATDDTYREAKVNFVTTRENFSTTLFDIRSKTQVVVTQGFIGRNKEGLTTTLGREGSDYTAAIIAYTLDVDQLTIWKDVPGILTADPRRFNNVELIDKLSYREAIEMTYYGAKVIHPKTIQPIQNKGIRLRVRSFLDQDNEGTMISNAGLLRYPPIVVIQDGITLMQIVSKDFSFIAEDHLSFIFDKMKLYNIKLIVMRNSAVSFTLAISYINEEGYKSFLDIMEDVFDVETYQQLQLITVRYFHDNLIGNLTKNKLVLFEEKLKQTIQLVVKPALELKEK